ncbi:MULTISPECIES: hypothetical protein [Acidiphilium]|jgi:hypothetical protein|uniref:Uncharacterized protein n=2 Tax=Acidiphilium TaxID=522 RepID=A5G234_ACICJ|nr:MULTISPECIES: hypothetical protein [Acidiphilium]ABQ31916.1 hypothetical protein Acry_2725 [Acidiphilium cryptum JF-5]KDM65987.1 hypothetical protein ACIDI_76c00270 [Acidiphilium sp. JA12-A1]BAJ82401.1 hypothetical protein ACMV_30540 [Acidiphilium multivorum AIU301]GAN73456.1 hypothetical protein Apmu_0078_01 [Acidiphilium multivorum AIU301]
MSFFQKSKWLILGVLSGCVAALAVVLLVKYAYDDPHPFSSRREVYDRMSVSYFHKIRQYGKLDAGQILHIAKNQDVRDHNFVMQFDPHDINAYHVEISNVPRRVCRYMVDMSYSSNIIKNIYIDNKVVDLVQDQPIGGRFLMVNGKAVTASQDAYARSLCARRSGALRIGLSVVVHRNRY